jgi:hypothetical protein
MQGLIQSIVSTNFSFYASEIFHEKTFSNNTAYLETIVGAQLVKESSTIYVPLKFITVYEGSATGFYWIRMNLESREFLNIVLLKVQAFGNVTLCR